MRCRQRGDQHQGAAVALPHLLRVGGVSSRGHRGGLLDGTLRRLRGDGEDGGAMVAEVAL